MLNFKIIVLADLLGSLQLTVYIAVQKNKKPTKSLKRVGHAFWFTAGKSFAYIKKSDKLIEDLFF